MAYDETLAKRVRDVLGTIDGVFDKKMFGGIAFMLHGNMAVGVMNDDLMVRVGSDAYEDALKLPGARVMDFTKRPMKGMIYVNMSHLGDDATLEQWVRRGLDYAGSLPAK